MERIIEGDCREKIKELDDDSIDLVVTSPPYAQQRKGLYDGIDEADYPEFTKAWMEALKPKLKPEGSALVVIRTHVRKGFISPYVLKTRLALHEAGWGEPEELIWHKPDGPPINSIYRPRRNFENILWFSLNRRPFVDLKACGKPSKRLGLTGRTERLGNLYGYANKLREGTARITDVVRCPVGGSAKGIEHPAMFPVQLAEFLIRSFCPVGGLVLDPFFGSGTTGVACQNSGREFIGIEKEAKYVEMASERVGRLSNGNKMQAT